MAKLIEKDGKKVIVTENETDLSDLNNSIKITQVSIDNIDHNMKGLQQRREKLVDKLNQLIAIKDSLQVPAKINSPVTVSVEPQA